MIFKGLIRKSDAGHNRKYVKKCLLKLLLWLQKKIALPYISVMEPDRPLVTISQR